MFNQVVWYIGVCMYVCIYMHIYTHMRRKWRSTPVFLPGKYYGPRRLAGYSPWWLQSRTWLSTQAYTHTHTHTHTRVLQPHAPGWHSHKTCSLICSPGKRVWHHFLWGWKTGWLCSPHLQIELWGLLDHLHAKTDNLFWISINWDFKESNFSCTLDTQGYSPTPFLCFSPSCPFKPYLHILSSKFLPRFLFFFRLFFPLSLSVVSLYPLIYSLFCGSLSLLW